MCGKAGTRAFDQPNPLSRLDMVDAVKIARLWRTLDHDLTGARPATAAGFASRRYRSSASRTVDFACFPRTYLSVPRVSELRHARLRSVPIDAFVLSPHKVDAGLCVLSILID